MNYSIQNKGEIILYVTPDGQTKIDVTLVNETVWLTLDQMATLFQRNKSTVSRHIKDAFESGELEKESVVAFFATTAADGKQYDVAYYNLDMIISIGYRVHNYRGVQFTRPSWRCPYWPPGSRRFPAACPTAGSLPARTASRRNPADSRRCCQYPARRAAQHPRRYSSRGVPFCR